MLTDLEAEQTYESLTEIAVEAGLDWLVEDVKKEASFGKDLKRKIQTEASDYREADFLPKRKGKPAAFIISEPYTAREKLRLLVDALEAVSVGITLGLAETTRFIGSELQELQTFEFVPDSERSESSRIDLNHDIQETNSKRLLDCLVELKGEI